MDTSALLAIIYAEPEADAFTRAIIADREACLPATCYMEASLKLDGDLKTGADDRLDRTISALGLTVVPVSATHAREARRASNTYGKRRHPAKLNFGDCFSYAVAKGLGKPLLFKGEDFSKTDIPAARPAA